MLLFSVTNFEFVFMVCLLDDFTADLVSISRELQSVNVDLFDCLEKITELKVAFKEAISDGRRYNKIFEQAFLSRLIFMNELIYSCIIH